MEAEKYIPGTRLGLIGYGTHRECVVDDADGHVALLGWGKREPGLGPPPWDVAQVRWRAGGRS